MNKRRISWDFDYHKPDDEKVMLHSMVRQECGLLAQYINETIPDSREKSLAITKLEEVMFWANAALAREPRPEEAK